MVNFSRKKRQPLNEDKCVILPINVPAGMAIPVLYVNGHQMKSCDKAKYLGDIFNAKGNDNDLINDRVAKGMMSMICCMGLVSEITLGAFLINSHIATQNYVHSCGHFWVCSLGQPYQVPSGEVTNSSIEVSETDSSYTDFHVKLLHVP